MLSLVRRAAVSTTSQIARNSAKGASVAFSTFSERERGEEARYFRQEEERRLREMREQMEKILALDDSHEHKQQLVEVLGETFFHFALLIVVNSNYLQANRRSLKP